MCKMWIGKLTLSYCCLPLQAKIAGMTGSCHVRPKLHTEPIKYLDTLLPSYSARHYAGRSVAAHANCFINERLAVQIGSSALAALSTACFGAERPRRCCAWLQLPCLAALVVDELQAEDGESPEEDHEGAQDAKDGADEGRPVVVELLQVAPDGDAASTWYDHLHSNGMTSMNLINGDAELFLKPSWSKQLP